MCVGGGQVGRAFIGCGHKHVFREGAHFSMATGLVLSALDHCWGTQCSVFSGTQPCSGFEKDAQASLPLCCLVLSSPEPFLLCCLLISKVLSEASGAAPGPPATAEPGWRAGAGRRVCECVLVCPPPMGVPRGTSEPCTVACWAGQ